MGIKQRQTKFPVETKSVKIPNHNKTKIMCIQIFLLKSEVIINDFSFGVKGEEIDTKEQVKTVKSGYFNCMDLSQDFKSYLLIEERNLEDRVMSTPLLLVLFTDALLQWNRVWQSGKKLLS
jgi:hypothetical protein